MRKILIVGIVASGKTTIARELSAHTGIPWFELDSIVHKHTDNGRKKQSADEQVKEIREINALGHWIFEGVYRASYHCLLDAADQIIFLDTPLWKRRYRIIARFIRQQLKIEPCHYKSDLHMLKMMFKWTKDFEQNRENFTQMLNKYSDKLVIIKKTSQYKTLF